MPDGDTEQSRKRIVQFFVCVGLIVFGMFSAAVPVSDEIKLNHNVVWPIWGLFTVIAVLSGFILLPLVICDPLNHRLLTSFIFLTGLALAASYCSLLLLVKVHALIAIVVPLQKLVIVGVIAYKGTRTREDPGIAYDEAYESEMDLGFDISKLSNTPAFSVQTALIVAYMEKTSSYIKPPSQADLAITYWASTLCLCSMMVTCMPLRFSANSQDSKEYLLATVKFLNYAMLVALAWIATTLAAEFLEGMVVLSFTLLLIASASFLAWKFQDGSPLPTNPGGSNWAPDIIKENKNIFIGSMAASYYIILVLVYLKFLGKQIDSLYIKFFVFVVLTAIMSGLALTPFTFKPPSRESSSTVAKIMVYFAGLLVLIVCFMVVYINIKRD
ncbi:uncharacterized protein [Typha angustifolia]|uniref:uncharacterized protein n=1 Tax=Typha angustifolia TaxID=59011 RepID=UPI003C2FEDEE